ncbi:MAG TPA: archaetidylserine decarboxylase [Gammaproteobacteria bacterium]|nr:phosphatidylserine decarboxylase [Gammaproteobacteria bacterium]MCW5584595.1 phosphatidylserine decarboxylase [Chromatiales bacterium]HOP16745.1 archaetidylserine decarboxylase [Gammaproteobacteria bacterium]HPQ23531.1 archaetidylserine decarboxylase [Gammaproteobacteria bacterium]
MPDPAKPTILDRLSTDLLRILPQHLLAAGMYRVARATTPWLKDLLISRVSQRYNVDISEAEQPDPSAYPSFNAFFTRALRAGSRPVAEGEVVSPADGRISQIGPIRGGRLLQAKGHEFELLALLAGDKEKTAAFHDGQFATVYLSPKDYHRVHLPFAGTLDSMVFVPGELFSVSDATTQLVPGLFARNERVICHFATDLGPMAVILVGAIFVGSMETVWHGEVRGQRGQPTRWVYRDNERRHFDTGDEIGRFNMGSTVITLLPAGAAAWDEGIGAASTVRMGQAIGHPLPQP